MTALPPDSARQMLDTASSVLFADSAAEKWKELHACSSQIADLAQLAPERFEGRIAGFAQGFSETENWRQELAKQGIEDIEAMVQAGLRALQVLTNQGSDPTAPALALWREFYHARETVLAIVTAKQGAA